VIFGLEKNEVTKDQWSLKDWKLNNKHCSQYFSSDQIKMKVLVEACNTCEIQQSCKKILVGKLEENYPSVRTLCRH
jgi:hypothetical protein